MFEMGCGMKLQWRGRDKPHSEGAIWDKTLACGIMSESQNLKIHEGTTLVLLSQALVFIIDRISALQSQVSGQCFEIWRRAEETWTIRDWNENARLGGMG